MDNKDRFESQLRFLIEVDKLKHIQRKTRLFDGSRFENDAEHAWHLAVMAMVLLEHSNQTGIDACKVLKMVLIHDIVEIDAGDTIVYDTQMREQAQAKEAMAAERIFGLLPEDQAHEFMGLWREFEQRETPEARFAAAIDRFEPILQNHHTDYCTWRDHGITFDQLHDRNGHIRHGSDTIWDEVDRIFSEARDKGIV